MSAARAPLGQNAIHLDRVDSTQTFAFQFAADPARHGLAIRADEQTAGRGRRGAHWLAPPGGCLMFSLLLFPPLPLRRPALLTILAGVAVCEAVFAQTKLRPTLKWPNDVLLGGKKIAGILIETAGDAVVLGVGLNVNIPARYFALAALPQASSLLAATGQSHSLDQLFHQLLERLDAGYENLLRGDLPALEAQWQAHAGLVGQKVELRSADQTRCGLLHSMNFAAVELKTADGQTLAFVPEVVQSLTPL